MVMTSVHNVLMRIIANVSQFVSNFLEVHKIFYGEITSKKHSIPDYQAHFLNVNNAFKEFHLFISK